MKSIKKPVYRRFLWKSNSKLVQIMCYIVGHKPEEGTFLGELESGRSVHEIYCVRCNKQLGYS